jgi:hypothetical protein
VTCTVVHQKVRLNTLARSGLGCCLADFASTLGAQVLNLSQDLVPLSIASHSLTPDNPALGARPLGQATFEYIQTQTLTVDTGAYYLLSPRQDNVILLLPSLHNLTIDLVGSTVYFNGPLFLIRPIATTSSLSWATGGRCSARRAACIECGGHMSRSVFRCRNGLIVY